MSEIESGPPRVTALIVSRNCAPQLERCLDALEHSSDRSRLEILVVDNGSHDGSDRVPEKFPEVQTLRLPKDFGYTKASNIAMRTAKGDLILPLPAWVVVQPDTIVTLADRLEQSQSIGAVCPYAPQWFRLPDAATLKAACPTGQLPDGQATRADADEIAVEYVPGAPVLVRKLFLRGMNYFDERYGDLWADLELAFQLKSAAKTTLMLPQVRVEYLESPARDADAVHTSDCIVGAATYLGKRGGSGFGFRVSAALGAFLRADFGLMSAIFSGQKVDGTHL